jgi:hypothetical protein
MRTSPGPGLGSGIWPATNTSRAGPCFSRQVSMYLARHVGRWSLSQIGKFYNGRHHTTVLHSISRVETFRETGESVDALIEVLTNELAAGPPNHLPGFVSPHGLRLSKRSQLE